MSSSAVPVCQYSEPALPLEDATEQWYALLTRSRHEKVVADRLRDRGFTTFLPLAREIRRWSDRKKVISSPLFSGYVFVKTLPTSEARVRVLRIDGVVQFVGVRGEGTPIPEQQIDAVRILLAENLQYSLHPFLKTGQRVRVRGGALDGIEGIFVARGGERALFVSVDAVERSLVVRIEGYDVEAL
jgi:transcription antitermination factor NusG